MAVVAAIGAVVVAGTGVAVSSNQQKVAAQKQSDAVGDAQRAQEKQIADQKKADDDRKAQEDKIVQAGFAKVASSRKTVSGSSLPGAVAQGNSIGSVNTPGAPGKTLIGA